MKISLLILILFFFFNLSGFGTKYLTKTGYIYFKSHTDAIDIDGSNHNVAAIFDSSTGEVVVIVLIKAFDLPLATANEHFNETYMESDKFPKASLKGKVSNFKDVNFLVDGEYPITLEGILSIHGESRDVVQNTVINVKDGVVSGKCSFKVNINDYSIVVPADVKNRVAQVVDVVVELSLKPQ